MKKNKKNERSNESSKSPALINSDIHVRRFGDAISAAIAVNINDLQ